MSLIKSDDWKKLVEDIERPYTEFFRMINGYEIIEEVVADTNDDDHPVMVNAYFPVFEYKILCFAQQFITRSIDDDYNMCFKPIPDDAFYKISLEEKTDSGWKIINQNLFRKENRGIFWVVSDQSFDSSNEREFIMKIWWWNDSDFKYEELKDDYGRNRAHFLLLRGG